MSLYPVIHKIVVDAFAGNPAIIRHLERTEYWARTLRPDLDDALRCAAVAHDIERSEPDSAANIRFRRSPFQDPKALAYHQQRGAEIIADRLVTKGVTAAQISRIQDLIAHHETGGTVDQNFIMDMDSLSFLENNLDYFLEKLLPSHGAAEVTAKFDWMYQRISDKKIRELAEPYYHRAIAILQQQLQ